MAPPLLLQANPPGLADFANWASGRGLPAVATCGVLVLVALVSLIRIASRRRCAADFDESDNLFLSSFRDSAHVLAIFQAGAEFPGSPRWQVYLAGCRELAFHLVGVDRVEKNFTARLRAAGLVSVSRMNVVRRAMERAAGEIGVEIRSVTSPPSGSVATLRWTGLMLGMAVFAEAALHAAGAHEDLPQMILPAFLPLALSMVLSLVVSASAGALIRRNHAAAIRLQLFPAELSIMIERVFVAHDVPAVELPSVAALGAPAPPGFNFPPPDGFTRAVP